MRALSDEEAALWAKVTATIRPLDRTVPPASADLAPPQPQPVPPPIVRWPKGPPPRRASPPAAPAGGPGQTLDSSWDRRLRDGAVVPDRVVDLHGHHLDSAWQEIDRSLERAIAAGDRLVLLITGHARPGDAPLRRGRIRSSVHDWLRASRHAPAIAAVRDAHRRHGGGGSLYIILRRQRG